MNKISLENIVRRVRDMPVLPERVKKIIILTEDPDSTIEDIENEILKDQSLTSKVLKLANSTYYGYPRKINTVSQATILLGFNTIKSITLASTISEFMNKELKGYALGKYELWEQSQTCAIASRYIAQKVKFPDIEQAYIGGLLRDIGKTILNCYVEREYVKIMRKVKNENITFIDAEEEVLGFNHAQIGEKVAEKWNFPDELVEAIGLHHTPEKAEVNPKLVSIVHVADAITMMMGINLGVDGLNYNFSKYAVEQLNIKEQDIQVIISDVSDLLLDEDSFNIV